MWVAGAILLPGYRTLGIVRDMQQRADLLEKGLSIIRKPLRQLQDATAPVGHTTSILPNVFFGGQSAHMEDMMEFSGSQETEEIKKYECERFSESIIVDIKKPNGEIRYWARKRVA